MTCIAALAHRGRVWIGGDSASSDAYWHIAPVQQPKVFRVGEMVIGNAGSWRICQLLQHKLTLPPIDAKNVEGWLVTKFIDAVREALKAGGVAKKENEVEEGGVFLVGLRGRLYRADHDYQIIPVGPHGVAIGSGASVAIGALYATHGLRWTPSARIRLALQASAHATPFVRAPFRIIATRPAVA